MPRLHRLLPLLALLSLGSTPFAVFAQPATPTPSTPSVVASGFTNPRGFAWGPDGALYLALAGAGGTSSSIVKIEHGCATTIADGIPSRWWKERDWVWGAMDVAVLDGRLYVLSAGGGNSGSHPDTPKGIYRLEDDGSLALVADLGAWLSAHPTSFIPPDYDPEGSLFDLEAGPDALFVSEAVGGRVVKITLDGAISLVADLSDGHLVPTGIALGADGSIYVGYETSNPFPMGASKVSKIAPDGSVSDAWTGLTAVTDIAIGPDGTLYAAEMAAQTTDQSPYLVPNTGRIVRQTGPGSQEVVVDGLQAPVFLGFGPDGELFYDLPAYGADNGEGSLFRLGSAPAATPASCPPPG